MGKKKRSHCSSTKEEKTEKNKAANQEQETTKEPVEEPSLSEIRKLLAEIQSSMSVILAKNCFLTNEFAELKNAFES